MKKALYIVIPIIVIVLSIGIYFGASVLDSPEYALMQIGKDVEESGVDGLTPHLTGEAQETVSAITSITENKLVNSILTFLGKDDYTSILKSNLQDVEWSLVNILKGDNKADVVLGFNYNEKLIGEIEFNMIKDDGEWKISGLEQPKFTEINFGQ